MGQVTGHRLQSILGRYTATGLVWGHHTPALLHASEPVDKPLRVMLIAKVCIHMQQVSRTVCSMEVCTLISVGRCNAMLCSDHFVSSSAQQQQTLCCRCQYWDMDFWVSNKLGVAATNQVRPDVFTPLNSLDTCLVLQSKAQHRVRPCWLDCVGTTKGGSRHA